MWVPNFVYPTNLVNDCSSITVNNKETAKGYCKNYVYTENDYLYYCRGASDGKSCQSRGKGILNSGMVRSLLPCSPKGP